MTSTIMTQTTLTFGDGTTQSTAIPTKVSGFTNDSGYLTDTQVSSRYATKADAVGSISMYTGYGMTLYADNINGTHISGGFINCNCNC